MQKIKVVGLIGLKGSGKDTCAQYLVEEKEFKRAAFADKLYKEVAEAFNVSVEFLGNRDTKETPLKELTIANCKDSQFGAIIQELKNKELAVQRSEQNAAIERGDPVLEVILPDTFGVNEWLSPRQVMQLWGTDYKRKYVQDSYWLDVVKHEIFNNPRNYVITDVRFNNEANFIESLNGQIVESNGIVYVIESVLIRIRREKLEIAFDSLDQSKQHSSETELRSRNVSIEIENEEGNPDSLKRILHLI